MRMRGICRDFADLQFLKSAKGVEVVFFQLLCEDSYEMLIK